MAKSASKFHPTRIWRGYASALIRPVMPLAKFFYGDAHKWYFRSAATVLVAVFVAAIGVSYTGHARWVSYLLAFGAISLIYWCFYAPAKWATKDCLRDPRSPTGPEYNFNRVLNSDLIRSIIFKDGCGEGKSNPPPEVALLSQYLQFGGRIAETSEYLHAREWHPPACWAGQQEFQLLLQTAEDQLEECLTKLGHEPEDFPIAANHRIGLSVNMLYLIKVVVFLDVVRPEWREHAIAWNRGRRSLLLWRLQRLWNLVLKAGLAGRIGERRGGRAIR